MRYLVKHVDEQGNALPNREARRRAEAVLRQKGDTPHGAGRRSKKDARRLRKAARRVARLMRRRNR